MLVGVEWKGRAGSQSARISAEESLEELAELAVSAGGTVAQRFLQSRAGPEASTLIGSGKVAELGGAVATLDADVVIFDHELTPTQQRNLEKALQIKVLDRTQLILDTFASRARTREGRLQVELAQLSYLLPRLAGRGIEMSRLGGGIGTRGPGETQLETDRRRIARRIQKIKLDLEGVRAGRALHRRRRVAVPLATLALAGYTNAGKSTLFNRLTQAGVLADARMFATLDPTVRPLDLPSHRRVLLSDTVGFIRNLPTTLVEAFRATLEEVTESALVLHVLDASSPSAPEHVAHVRKLLAEIGAGNIPQLLVMNKIDRLEKGLAAGFDAAAWGRRMGNEDHGVLPAVGISALTGSGLDRLVAAIDAVLPLDPILRAVYRFPAADGATLAMLHTYGKVLEVRYEGSDCLADVEAPESLARRVAQFRQNPQNCGKPCGKEPVLDC